MAELHQQLAVRVRAAPDAVHLHVCEEGGRLSSRTVAKLRLPPPARLVARQESYLSSEMRPFFICILTDQAM